MSLFANSRKGGEEAFDQELGCHLAPALFCDALGGAGRKEGPLFPRMSQWCPVDHQCLPHTFLVHFQLCPREDLRLPTIYVEYKEEKMVPGK